MAAAARGCGARGLSGGIVAAARCRRDAMIPVEKEGRHALARAAGKPLRDAINRNGGEMVPKGGIEPPTLRFSVACSTN